MEALEVSAGNYRRLNMLQFSGLKVIFNMTNPIGSRVVNAKVLCNRCQVPKYEELDKTQFYSIVAQSFLADGANGYTMFKEHRLNYL